MFWVNDMVVWLLIATVQVEVPSPRQETANFRVALDDTTPLDSLGPVH